MTPYFFWKKKWRHTGIDKKKTQSHEHKKQEMGLLLKESKGQYMK